MKVKKEFIGASTSVQGIGQIKIREDHADVLAKAGRFELLEGPIPNFKKLVPVEKEQTPDYSEMKVKDLRDLAKDLDGYKSSMNKHQLIELLNATTE
jgi:hypothetical protein